MSGQIALRPSYWASVSGGKDSLYMLNFAYLYKYYPDNFQFMIEKMRETEELRERESLVDRSL